MIRVKKVENKEELDLAFAVREKVFIEEQLCDREEEFDEFDPESTHFIAYYQGEPAGTSRYRTTKKGVKLERFAVYEEYRGKGVGKRLVQIVLADVENNVAQPGTLIYLHAQLTAMPLYSKYGFTKVGEKFIEAGIEHFEMQKTL
ncbi:putative GNAT family N-acyltransferase [Roseivirga ehrenbergii]|uniref:GNAT family acetyltransferase n=1 Tax=Roseivirga ehrenbergii (strain DSM 102268 / JCM 13514 / KCTC 12282 / NCIMB 14502 / KMM 6017) TaxID=279360 RepID=A0A150XTC4_ROSEK|nr:GNAT family N-acetyltransferase [Roseivirga ehrenbergii]KYG81990.1 GNAT family acetyltransferase [Roseivirga ehrenbergii]TCL01808.1 putative GNAT family N-acyltransferase [Roseivirga ehrenbergii]